VVIGYGSARKSDVTGSIASVGGEKLRGGAATRRACFRGRRNGGESRRAPWRSVPLKKLNFQFHIKFEFAVKAKAAESLVPSNDSAAFLFAAFSMQHRQTAFLSKRLFYLCRQEQSKVEQHDRCCDCSHDQ